MASKANNPSTIQIHYVPMHTHPSSRSLTDVNTEAGKAWKKFIELLEGVAGVEKVWWAFQDDNEDNVGVFAYWQSLNAQRTWESTHPIAFIASLLSPILSPTYPSFTSKRFTILLPVSTTSASHPTTTALNAPITKIWTWWFPLASFSALKSSVPASFDAFVKANIRDAEGVVAYGGGWREEEDLMGERRARSFTGFVGVRTEEAFFGGPPPFEGNIERRIGLGLRTFRLGGHGRAVMKS